MAVGKGLGKGFDAIMGDISIHTPEAGALSLPISQVQPNPNQPRRRFDPDNLQDLADSIRENGMLQPITVRRTSTGYYQIIAGERRWRAAKMADLREIPAVVIEADDRTALELALVENLQREDLNPIEEAEGYALLSSSFGLTQEDIAEKMGKSRSTIANAMRLNTLSEKVRDMVLDGYLTAGHARAVLSIEQGPEAQEVFADLLVEHGLNVRQAENAAKHFVWPIPEKQPKEQNPNQLYINTLEKDLSAFLGRKVSISDRGKKGKITLEYYNTEDLNDLVELLQQSNPQAAKGGEV